jgi:hypothetical protein
MPVLITDRAQESRPLPSGRISRDRVVRLRFRKNGETLAIFRFDNAILKLASR